MSTIIFILTFIIVLFFYIHVIYHKKTSNDLEVYELSPCSKDRLEELCDLRQPIIFNTDITKYSEININNLLNKYSSFDIKIKNINNFYENKDNDIYLPIQFSEYIKLLNTENDENDEDENQKNEENSKKYLSENNNDFLEETCLIQLFKSNDSYIRPLSIMNYEYDIIFGKLYSNTILQYNINYRNFFTVITGKIKIKLAPPKSSKYLYKIDDYENFEFKSPLNVWNIQEKYRSEFNKLNFLEIELKAGQTINIPPYWWYSIRIDEKDTIVISHKYRTYMNNLAVLPKIVLSFLQKQNIKHKILENIKTN